jgi:hypothetical protein
MTAPLTARDKRTWRRAHRRWVVANREAYRIYHRRWQAEHRLMLTYLPRALRTIEELCRP